MRCPSCGQPTDDLSRSCEECGIDICVFCDAHGCVCLACARSLMEEGSPPEEHRLVCDG